jgi:TatD DNase family protein
MLVDTHAHLDDEAFAADRDDVLRRARAAGVARVLAVGTTAATSLRCAGLAERFPGVYAAVGIQPNYVHEALPGDWEAVVALLDRPRVAALGETGLDRYWHDAPWETQQDYFDRHLRLAQQRDVPLVIHMRDCGPEIAEMLREARRRGPLRGVMHSFTGDEPLMRECVELGLHISFAGMVTYKKSTALRACAALAPADRLLVETDSPYLSPEPVRGQRPNEPANVRFVAACLAETRGVPLAVLAQQTSANAANLFRLPPGEA